MSFEGTTYYLCANGHLRECDVWSHPTTCSCGADPSKWERTHDETNGYDEKTDPSTKLVMDVEATINTCSLGFQHIATERTYKIPEERVK